MNRLILDTSRGGLGDIITCAWIAAGANTTGEWKIDFARGPGENHISNRVLAMLGQNVVNEPGIELHVAEGGFTRWNLTVRGARIPRPRLWQIRIGELAGVKLRVEPRCPSVHIGDKAMAWAAAQRRPGKRFLLAFPFAAWSVRTWPPHKLRRLLYTLESEGWHTLALHAAFSGTGADGKPQGDLGMFPHWQYGPDIEHIAALCKTADAVIGSGSGGTILSGTIGTPTFAMLGPDDPVVSYGFLPSVQCLCPPKSRISCGGCQYDRAIGYHDTCDLGCDALASLSWQEAHTAIKERFPA